MIDLRIKNPLSIGVASLALRLKEALVLGISSLLRPLSMSRRPLELSGTHLHLGKAHAMAYLPLLGIIFG